MCLRWRGLGAIGHLDSSDQYTLIDGYQWVPAKGVRDFQHLSAAESFSPPNPLCGPGGDPEGSFLPYPPIDFEGEQCATTWL